MEEGSFEQFMVTGKIEDYLKFKSVAYREEKGKLLQDKSNTGIDKSGKREKLCAGYSEGNSHSSSQYTCGRI